ncbi:MAG: hypothetical protein APF84_01520 [Gracilibacter sp. BRH_c7a]|nr:MAG: hypothetical protein APF84_01520 [Gracilibacter sp. BRH_c7a]
MFYCELKNDKGEMVIMKKLGLYVVLIILIMSLVVGCSDNTTAPPQEEKKPANLMTFKEFQSLSDNEKLKNKEMVKEVFGEPDFVTQKDGYEKWAYYDRIDNEKGSIFCALFTFYETGQTGIKEWPTKERLKTILNI